MHNETKELLAKTLITMLQKNSVNKISVKLLTDKCELSRQTFYNYFKDIYDLVEWIYLRSIEKFVINSNKCRTWQQSFCRLLEFTRDNKAFIQNTYKYSNRDALEKYMYSIIYDLTLKEVERQAGDMCVDKKYKSFIARFFSLAFLNLDLEWIKSGMREEPAEMVEEIDALVKGDFAKALNKYAVK